MNGTEDERGDEAGRIRPPERGREPGARIERIGGAKLVHLRLSDPSTLPVDQDARLVARLIALLEEAMDLAKSRSGEAGRALIDNLAVEIFRVISSGQIAPPQAAPERADAPEGNERLQD